MNGPLFELVLTKQPQADAEQVYRELARLWAVDAVEAKRRLQSGTATVSGGLSYHDALRLHNALTQLGAVCRVVHVDHALQPEPKCPRCSVARLPGRESCQGCGVYFHKLQARNRISASRGHVGRKRESLPWLPQDAKQPLLIGLLTAVVVLVVPLFDFVAGYLRILIHELGHAVVAWSFGYPAIPAFDFVYGGGVTHAYDRADFLLLLIFASWAGFFVWLWQSGRANWLSWALAALALYSLLAFTQLHTGLIFFMGHGTELVIAGLFLHRAITGVAVHTPAERPVYAFAAFYLLLKASGFAFSLLFDAAALQQYLLGKGGIDNDFVHVARDFLGVSVPTVAGIYLLLVPLSPLIAWRRWRHSPPARLSKAESILAEHLASEAGPGDEFR